LFEITVFPNGKPATGNKYSGKTTGIESAKRRICELWRSGLYFEGLTGPMLKTTAFCPPFSPVV
jgi:hypothetical protein